MKKLPTEIGKSRLKVMEGSCRIIMFLAAGAVFAQPQDSRPAYVVASVKPNASFSDSSSSHGSTGQIVFTNLSLKRYIERAYNVKPFQVIGPDWMESVHFDITAKYPPDTKDADRPAMLRTLLEDRFKLAVHRESKEMPGYRLVVAKGGFKLKPVEARRVRHRQPRRTRANPHSEEDFDGAVGRPGGPLPGRGRAR